MSKAASAACWDGTVAASAIGRDRTTTKSCAHGCLNLPRNIRATATVGWVRYCDAKDDA